MTKVKKMPHRFLDFSLNAKNLCGLSADRAAEFDGFAQIGINQKTRRRWTPRRGIRIIVSGLLSVVLISCSNREADIEKLRLENEHLRLEVERGRLTQHASMQTNESAESIRPTGIKCETSLRPTVRFEEDKEDGKIRIEECLDSAGLAQGNYHSYYPGGQKRSEGIKRDNKLNGIKTNYGLDGSVQSKSNWIDGRWDIRNGVKSGNFNLELVSLSQSGSKCTTTLKLTNSSSSHLALLSLDFVVKRRDGTALEVSSISFMQVGSNGGGAYSKAYLDVTCDTVSRIDFKVGTNVWGNEMCDLGEGRVPGCLEIINFKSDKVQLARVK